ncbi:MAG: hypothetical protein ACKODX_21760 [Gemmata sp.]|jgi:hypothetical protein
MRAAVLAAAFLAAPVLADEKAAVKEIPTKDLKLKVPDNSRPTAPAEVKTADELAKCPACAGEAEALKKLVNFEKEKLLVFAWAGSGQDVVAVTGTTKDGKTVVAVAYTPGRTRDLRQHVKLFAVPKDATVEVKK